MTRQEKPAQLAAAAAQAAEHTPGVAYLRPGLGDLVRGAAFPQPRRTPGVRVRRSGTEGWALELHLAVERGHRALDVGRAVRAAVGEAVREELGSGAPLSVTVTVTDVA